MHWFRSALRQTGSMLTMQVRIIGPEGEVEATALIDTGFTGGILVPLRIITEIGAVLVAPERPLLAVDGRELPGQSSVVGVEALRSGLPPKETLAYVPESEFNEVLVGAFLLKALRATMRIGKLRLGFAPMARNPEPLFDLSQWRLPTHRPARRLL